MYVYVCMYVCVCVCARACPRWCPGALGRALTRGPASPEGSWAKCRFAQEHIMVSDRGIGVGSREESGGGSARWQGFGSAAGNGRAAGGECRTRRARQRAACAPPCSPNRRRARKARGVARDGVERGAVDSCGVWPNGGRTVSAMAGAADRPPSPGKLAPDTCAAAPLMAVDAHRPRPAALLLRIPRVARQRAQGDVRPVRWHAQGPSGRTRLRPQGRVALCA